MHWISDTFLSRLIITNNIKWIKIEINYSIVFLVRVDILSKLENHSMVELEEIHNVYLNKIMDVQKWDFWGCVSLELNKILVKIQK